MIDKEMSLLAFLQSCSQDEISCLVTLAQGNTKYDSFVEALTDKLLTKK